MAFPTTWLQVWCDLPDGGTSGYPSLAFWFSVVGVPDTTFPLFELDMLTDVQNWLQNVTNGIVSISLGVASLARCYYRSPTANIDFYSQCFFPGPHLALPHSKTVVIHRERTPNRDAPRGLINLSGILLGLNDGDHLTPAGLAIMQVNAQNMALPFTSRGAQWVPSFPSWKFGTLNVIDNCYASPRLGLLHRRARENNRRGLPTGPKTPPP